MNQELWNRIEEFDLDQPVSEFGFSTRLAGENQWTRNFTAKAILEYKKFMYLAAVSDTMVSPSGVVDIVWHQHLIFTKSYEEFCGILGKIIQHVPSTRQRGEFEVFRQARERTKQLYTTAFGAQPEEIWNYASMFDSLELPKAKLKIRAFVLIGISVFVALAAPFYFLLRPVYVHIGNPDFIIGFAILTGMVFLLLHLFNRWYLSRVVLKWPAYSFVHDLQPQELLYLRTGQPESVIHDTVNQMVHSEKIRIRADLSVEKGLDLGPDTLDVRQVMATLKNMKQAEYPDLLKRLLQKPVFRNVSDSMDAFRKYMIKSRAFGKLFYFNFAILALLLLLGFVRFSTGLMRDLAVGQIALTIIILTVLIVLYLKNLTTLVCRHTVPAFYEQIIIPAHYADNIAAWKYFLMGVTVLAFPFQPLVRRIERDQSLFGKDSSGSSSGSSGGNSCGSSGGGSCGSSCGSSCGGCGGGD
jgi:uncharacterized protein (TIGR04222 family)